MNSHDINDRLPKWFHRANWAGGALACFGIGAFPLIGQETNWAIALWAFFWAAMGLGAARNAKIGKKSIHIPKRLDEKK